jgi:hypothetical protein
MEPVKSKLTFGDLQIGTKVKIVAPMVDFSFFYGEIGAVIENNGNYLGITVEFDKPRQFKDGEIQKTFNFNPCDLELIDKVSTEFRCTECGKLHNDGEDCPEVKSALAAAEQRGYEMALDDILKCSTANPPVCLLVMRWVKQLKSDYLRQEGKNGKTE